MNIRPNRASSMISSIGEMASAKSVSTGPGVSKLMGHLWQRFPPHKGCPASIPERRCAHLPCNDLLCSRKSSPKGRLAARATSHLCEHGCRYTPRSCQAKGLSFGSGRKETLRLQKTRRAQGRCPFRLKGSVTHNHNLPPHKATVVHKAMHTRLHIRPACGDVGGQFGRIDALVRARHRIRIKRAVDQGQAVRIAHAFQDLRPIPRHGRVAPHDSQRIGRKQQPHHITARRLPDRGIGLVGHAQFSRPAHPHPYNHHRDRVGHQRLLRLAPLIGAPATPPLHRWALVVADASHQPASASRAT
mmetsp:Transcript_23304/g.40388  ORF Transcript_23304/g.40388 Transcript_23304/m.40388 type:complete len:302 (+) Transcript_23304:237-1142(+)